MKKWKELINREPYEKIYNNFIEELADKMIDKDGPKCEECMFENKCNLFNNVDICKIGMMEYLNREVEEKHEEKQS